MAAVAQSPPFVVLASLLAMLLLLLPGCSPFTTLPRSSRRALRPTAAAGTADTLLTPAALDPNLAATSPLALSAAAAAAAGDDDVAAPGNNVPFFATLSEPAFPETAPLGGGAGTTTVTTRVPLGTLFDSRDYIFTAATNVRGYEWTTREADELFDDLADVAVGTSSPNRHGGDYELSQIVLVPMEWDRAALGLGARYDVHDGQQRLVTLCLLFAALRESFRGDAATGGEDGAAMEGIVEELTSMLNPPKVRKAPVLRIELRERDNEMLRRILTPELVDDDDDSDVEGRGGCGVRIDLPPADERQNLSATNRRVLSNYERLADRVSDLTVEERLELLDYLVEHVYMLVCVPETSSIARNIVMGQGKGMNTEPIDDFKGIVCFRYTLKEDDMYRTFDQWDNLAAMPDLESGSVGRDTVASACLLRATAAMRTKIRKNDEAYALERWLRADLIRNEYEGTDFYGRNVEPASLALRKFRDGSLDSFGFFANGGEEEGGDRELQRSIATRLRFLRGLASGVASTKEVEIVILELLLRAEGAEGSERITLQDLDGYLRGVELAAGWMAMARPSPLERHQRCFAMLDAIDAGNLDEVLDAVASEEEKSNLRDELASFDFGATPIGKKIALSLLERLNAHLLAQDSKAELPESEAAQYHVEHILPKNPYRKYWKDQWPNEDDRDYWVHRLGNLALVSRKVTAKEGNSAFNDKKERYEKEVWPLTRQLSKLEDWSKEALIEQQGKSIGLISKIWGL